MKSIRQAIHITEDSQGNAPSTLVSCAFSYEGDQVKMKGMQFPLGHIGHNRILSGKPPSTSFGLLQTRN